MLINGMARPTNTRYEEDIIKADERSAKANPQTESLLKFCGCIVVVVISNTPVYSAVCI